MAEFKLVGVSHSSGTFNGNAYDNMLLHVTFENKNISGLGAKVIKVKAPVYSANPLKVGESFDVNYDQYGNAKALIKA